MRPLNDEVALEKGIEFYWEILIYIVLILLPTYEIIKAHNSNIAKSEKSDKRLQSLESQVEENKKLFLEKYQ